MGMRPSRSSLFICSGSAAPRQDAATLAVGAATCEALARGEARALAASKSTPQVLPSGLPTWAAALAAAGRRAKSGIVFPDTDGGNANPEGEPVVDGIGSLNKRRATSRSSRLEPLLTVAHSAAILNVSERTVRRLIACGTIRGIWIGRLVRLRPRDIEQCIAGGGTCND
jgi:excisionase family DNA binding protein